MNEVELRDLPVKELEITLIMMLTEVREQCMNKVSILTERQKMLESIKHKS